MYSDHMPQLREHGFGTYQGFCDLVTFVTLSIRVQFTRVPDQMKDTRKLGENSPHLWGWKMDTYRALQGDVGRTAWDRVRKVLLPEEAILALIPIPGLGIVKAGFVAQMLGFECGCLDGRNMEKFEITERTFRWDKNHHSAISLERKIDQYVDTCIALGGSKDLWDGWCEDLAQDNGEKPGMVSAMHLAAISEHAMATAMCRVQ